MYKNTGRAINKRNFKNGRQAAGIINFRVIRYFIITVVILVIILGGILVSSNAMTASAPEEITEEITEEIKVYTSIRIQEGDSLWSIASQYHEGAGKDITTYIDELKTMNNIVNDRSLKAGNYLVIYYLH